MVDSQQLLPMPTNMSKRIEKFFGRNRKLHFTHRLVAAANNLIDFVAAASQQPATLKWFLSAGMQHHFIDDFAQDDHRQLLHQVDRININRDPSQINLLRPEKIERPLQHVMQFFSISGLDENLDPEVILDLLNGGWRRAENSHS